MNGTVPNGRKSNEFLTLVGREDSEQEQTQKPAEKKAPRANDERRLRQFDDRRPY